MQISQDASNPIPTAILNKPILPGELFDVWEAFWLLNSCRQSGFSVQPLSLQEIKAYFDIYGKVDDYEAFIEYIKQLDMLFLKKAKEEYDRNSNKSKNNKR